VDEELKELERKRQLLLERKKKKKKERERKEALTEVSKSPSPVKTLVSKVPANELRPRNLTQELIGNTRSVNESIKRKEDNGSTSYFVKMLEEGHSNDQAERDEARKLLSSRIYTFSEDLECEPFAVDEKEHYSGKNISKRYLTHDALTKIFEDKKVLRISKLFAKVAPPSFQEPRYPNWVVIGIISKKTVPKGTSDSKSKYITMTLTDFKLHVDVHIFGTAVEKYNKLRLGDVIAILNPEIFLWKPDSKGVIRSFSLSIKHTFDCILEIGKSKDFGLCQSLKRDGTMCGTPIDTSFQDCCVFHKELRIRKTQGKRMELNGSFNLRSPTKNGRKQQFLMGGKDKKGDFSNSAIVEDRYAPKVDRVSKSLVYFSNPHAGRAFFDEKYQNPDIMKNLEDKKRKIQERKKESELKAKLLRLGDKSHVKKAIPMTEEEKSEVQKKKALLKTAFQGSSLQSIGYDPTSKPHTKGVLDSEELGENNESLLDELSSLAQSKNISLGKSKEELAKHKELRSEAAKMMKRIKAKEEALEKDAKGETKELQKSREVIRKKYDREVELDDASYSDSDSDFEVEGGDTKDAYAKFIQTRGKKL